VIKKRYKINYSSDTDIKVLRCYRAGPGKKKKKGGGGGSSAREKFIEIPLVYSDNHEMEITKIETVGYMVFPFHAKTILQSFVF
jgi:hypothetical protein